MDWTGPSLILLDSVLVLLLFLSLGNIPLQQSTAGWLWRSCWGNVLGWPRLCHGEDHDRRSGSLRSQAGDHNIYLTSSNTIHYQWKSQQFGSSYRNIFVEISRLQSKKCWRTEKKIDRFFQVFPGVQDNTTRETPPHCRLEAVGRGLPWCYANIWEHSGKGKDQKKN